MIPGTFCLALPVSPDLLFVSSLPWPNYSHPEAAKSKEQELLSTLSPSACEEPYVNIPLRQVTNFMHKANPSSRQMSMILSQQVIAYWLIGMK